MTLTVGCYETRQASGYLAEHVAEQVAAAVTEPAWGVRDLRVRVQAPAQERGPIVGQVNFTALGWTLRAQAACDHPGDLAGLLAARVSRQMVVPRSGLRARPWPDPLAGVPPTPVGPARISRRKRVRLSALTPVKAILTLDALDYQAHMFLDPQTGAEAVVYRDGPCGYRIAQAVPAEAARPVPAALVADFFAPPRLTLSRALTRLTAFGETHLFFTDATTGRGSLLYVRYAGGYGLVEPLA